MTQTPPVSPDFATPPKELVDRAREFLGHTSPYSLVKAFAVELLAAEERGASREREQCAAIRLAAQAIIGQHESNMTPINMLRAALAEKDKTP